MAKFSMVKEHMFFHHNAVVITNDLYPPNILTFLPLCIDEICIVITITITTNISIPHTKIAIIQKQKTAKLRCLHLGDGLNRNAVTMIHWKAKNYSVLFFKFFFLFLFDMYETSVRLRNYNCQRTFRRTIINKLSRE